MDAFKNVIRKTMAHKHMGKALIGAIAVNEVRKFFDIKVVADIDEKINYDLHDERDTQSCVIDGYLKFNKLFIKTNDQNIKIDIFKNKKQIIEKVNLAISKIGYGTKIVDIFLK